MRYSVLAVLLTIVAGAFSPGAAQPVATFHASVALVPISAVVRDRHGHLVTTLSATDFEVFDNGERRQIVDFETERDGPVSLAVLVDVSGSMRIGPKLALAGDVVDALSANLLDGRDEIGLFTFDAGLHEQQPFTFHPARLAGAVSATRPFGTTSLYDAIAETARQLAVRAAPRRAIVVVTDGIDTSSTLTPAQVSGLASAIDVPVYVLVAVPPIDHALFLDREEARTPQATADLRDLAQWTGGDLLWVTAGRDAAQSVHDVLSELRQEYVIAIEASADTSWRPLDLRVRNRSLTVRARSGYFAKDAGSK